MQVFSISVFLSSIQPKLIGGGSSCYIVTLLIVFNTVFVKSLAGVDQSLNDNDISSELL